MVLSASINFKVKTIFGLISKRFESSIDILFVSVISLVMSYIKFNSFENLGLKGIRYFIGIFFLDDWLINKILLNKKLFDFNSIKEANFSFFKGDNEDWYLNKFFKSFSLFRR